jgi:hypothetical protein
LYHIGDFSAFIVLTDFKNAITKNIFDFKVKSPPKFVDKVAKKLDIIASN